MCLCLYWILDTLNVAGMLHPEFLSFFGGQPFIVAYFGYQYLHKSAFMFSLLHFGRIYDYYFEIFSVFLWSSN